MSERDPLTQSTVDRVKKNIADAGNNVAGKVSDFVETAKNGNTSVRGLALVSGVALVVSSSNQVYGGIVTLRPISALIAFYSLVMGSIAIAMETDPQALPYGERIRNWLIKYIGLVQLSAGRGLFYFIAGSLELAQDGNVARIVGFFTVLVAIVYIIVGRRATYKVRKLREEIYPERVLRSKFDQFDADGDGQLDDKEFHEFLKSLNIDIPYQGAEMLFVSLDRDMQGGLDFEEFKRFWSDDPLTLIPM